MLTLLMTAGALFTAASGCASSGSRHPDYPAGRPLPLSVGVYLEPTLTRLPTGASSSGAGDDSAAGMLHFTREAKDVLEELVVALVGESALVERAVQLDARSLADAVREGRDHDLLVGVGLRTADGFPGRVRGDLATLEVLSWLFGGIPSWYVPTREYDLGATAMALELTDMNHPEVRGWLADEAGDPAAPPGPDFEVVAKIERQGLSLAERSAFADEPGDYLLTIVVPPMVVTSGSSRGASEALTRKISSRLHDGLKQTLRRRLVELEVASPLRVVIDTSAIGGLGAFNFDLVSDRGAPLEALDVHRRTGGAASYHWKATDAELGNLDAALASSEDGRLTVALADPIPLVEGENMIKVSVLRQDGVRTTRSVVVLRGGAER